MVTNGSNGKREFENPTVLLVGPPKVGKSTAVIRALGKAAFWICTERGALIPALDRDLNPSNVIPDHITCLDIQKPYEEVMAAMQFGIEGIKNEKYVAIVMDTLTSFADREYYRIITFDKVSEGYARARTAFERKLMRIIGEVLRVDGLFVAIAHETEPTNFEGKFKPGGPKLPGKLVESVPANFDIILRCGVELGPQGPRRVFRCNPLDRQWVTGDRYNVVAEVEDMDLLSVLRRAVTKARVANG